VPTTRSGGLTIDGTFNNADYLEAIGPGVVVTGEPRR
jgi:hypothetical protein